MTTGTTYGSRIALLGSATLLAFGCATASEPNEFARTSQEHIVFGADQRVEYGALGDPQLIAWADATASLFHDASIGCDATSCTLATSALSSGVVAGGASLPICAGERFAGQERGAACTAFLVGPDLLATAGHCVQSQADCDALNVAFGFVADQNGENEMTTLPAGDVYGCVDLIAQVFTGGVTTDDFALFRVDRPVTGRAPLALRTDGVVADGAELVTAGHPLGLPLKVVSEGQVRENPQSLPKFRTNLDASPGNSGSPVIDIATGLVEGIISSGPTPEWIAVEQNGVQCAVARVCDDVAGCGSSIFPEWADATRISGVVAALEGRSCHDDVLNGQETDVDCGGPECADCALGQSCLVNDDCPFRALCENSVCVPAPECVSDAECEGPQTPSCVVGTCVNNECNLDTSACECTTHAECDDGIACTEDICFGRTLACIHIPQNCAPACNQDTAVDLGPPGQATTVPNDGCVRVRDGYPPWWGTQRTLNLQTSSAGSYPVPFSWSNSCAGGGGNGEFTGDWQSQALSPTSSQCATVIDLNGSGTGSVTLRYF